MDVLNKIALGSNQLHQSSSNIFTVQISCKVPMVLWDTVKKIASCKGTTATSLTIKSLEKMISEYNRGKDLKKEVNVGDRVDVTHKNGEKYIQYTITKQFGVLGISVRQPGNRFIPLTDCKEIK